MIRRLLAASLFAILLPVCGLAATPTTRNMTFLANMNEYSQGANANNYSACWSYVHPDGREYAILGVASGTAIYNVTNPAAPYRVGFIPGPNSLWREMKSYRNWLYIVTEGTGPLQGLQIVRMTNPEAPVLATTYQGSFVRSHTVSVDTARAILICNGTRNNAGLATGLRVLSLANPEAPAEIGVWPNATVPVPQSQYVHDCVPIGNKLYASSIYAGIQRVLDFSTPSSPTETMSWTYPGGFTHNAWPDATGTFLYVTDEVGGEPLKVFDISNGSTATMVNKFTSNPQAIVHNAHVSGNELWLSNYTEGIRGLDLSDPAHPAEFAFADSYPGTSGGFFGVWEVCPYFPSGTVIASDMQTGLYVYRPVRDYGIVRVRVQTAASAAGALRASAACGGAGAQAVTMSCCAADAAEAAACCAPAAAKPASRAKAARSIAPVHSGSACGAGQCGSACTCGPGQCGAGGCSHTCGCHATATGLGGFKVVLDAVGDSLTTPDDGIVAFAPSPGAHAITVSRFGYVSVTVPLNVVDDQADTVTVNMVAKPQATFTGTIRSEATNVPLDDAEVRLEYTALHTHSDTLGQYALAGVPDDIYLVRVGRPGFAPRSIERRVGPGFALGDYLLQPAVSYDAFEAGSGWTVGTPGDAATSGLWVRVEPLGTGTVLAGGALTVEPAESGFAAADAAATPFGRRGTSPFHEGHEEDGAIPGDVQPEFDRTPGTGALCWITGQGTNPGSIGEADVDGGETSLLSPARDLTGFTDPVVGFWGWFYSSTPTDPGDYLRVFISNNNGVTWTLARTITGSQAHWSEYAVRVKDTFPAPSNTFRVKFVAGDSNPGSVVEAGIDDFTLYEAGATTVGVPGLAHLALRSPWPNPTRGGMRVELALPAAAHVDARVVDLQGRHVRTLQHGALAAGPRTLHWDGRDDAGRESAAGLYFVVASSPLGEARARVVRVR